MAAGSSAQKALLFGLRGLQIVGALLAIYLGILGAAPGASHSILTRLLLVGLALVLLVGVLVAQLPARRFQSESDGG